MEYLGDYWPTPKQKLVFQAGLLKNDIAKNAWQEYCESVNFQDIDYQASTFLPLVYHNFKDSCSTELKVCKSIYRYTWTANNLKIFKLSKVLAALNDHGIESCLLKGAAMITKYYQDPGLRVLGDIDILVPVNKAIDAIAILKTLGWKPKTELNEQQINALISSKHALSLQNQEGQHLDLHWSLFWAHSVDKALAAYQYRTCTMTLAQTQMQINLLSPEDQLIHTLLHSFNYNAQNLMRWLPDAVMIIRATPQFDWNYFLAQAQQLKIMFLTHTALYYLQAHQFINLPATVLTQLHQYQPSKVESKYFQIITQKSKKFIFTLQIFWFYHMRNSSSQNPLVLVLTLPHFLKKLWQHEHWHQVLFHLCQRLYVHLKNDLSSHAAVHKHK